MHQKVNNLIEEGSVRVDENGELSVVDAPSERGENLNQSFQRRKTEVNGMLGQLNASALMDG